MAGKEVMVDVAHREVHAYNLAGLQSLGFAESVTVPYRHHISADKHLVAVRAYINQFDDNVRIYIP